MILPLWSRGTCRCWRDLTWIQQYLAEVQLPRVAPRESVTVLSGTLVPLAHGSLKHQIWANKFSQRAEHSADVLGGCVYIKPAADLLQKTRLRLAVWRTSLVWGRRDEKHLSFCTPRRHLSFCSSSEVPDPSACGCSAWAVLLMEHLYHYLTWGLPCSPVLMFTLHQLAPTLAPDPQHRSACPLTDTSGCFI